MAAGHRFGFAGSLLRQRAERPSWGNGAWRGCYAHGAGGQPPARPGAAYSHHRHKAGISAGLHETGKHEAAISASMLPNAGSWEGEALGRIMALTPDEARSAARDVLAAVRLGRDPASERADRWATPMLTVVVRQLLDEEVAPKREPRTAALYKDYLERLVVPEVGSTRIDALTKAEATPRRISERFPLNAGLAAGDRPSSRQVEVQAQRAGVDARLEAGTGLRSLNSSVNTPSTRMLNARLSRALLPCNCSTVAKLVM